MDFFESLSVALESIIHPLKKKELQTQLLSLIEITKLLFVCFLCCGSFLGGLDDVLCKFAGKCLVVVELELE